MPLESLRQPFDPEQAGHKLREVQAEHEPEKERTALEQYEHVKEWFFDRQWYYRNGERSLTLEVGPHDPKAVLISFVEQKLGVSTSLGEKYQEYFSKTAKTAANVRESRDPRFALHLLPQNPRKAAVVWNKNFQKYYEFDKDSMTIQNRAMGKGISIGIGNTLSLLSEWSYINAVTAREKFEALKTKIKPNWTEGETWLHMGERRTLADLNAALIESSYDPEKAQRHLENLKSLGAYDSEENLWRLGITDGLKQTYYLEDQLYDILIRLRLEETGPRSVQEKPITLPEERNF